MKKFLLILVILMFAFCAPLSSEDSVLYTVWSDEAVGGEGADVVSDAITLGTGVVGFTVMYEFTSTALDIDLYYEISIDGTNYLQPEVEGAGVRSIASLLEDDYTTTDTWEGQHNVCVWAKKLRFRVDKNVGNHADGTVNLVVLLKVRR